jgi:hypothetical protein
MEKCISPYVFSMNITNHQSPITNLESTCNVSSGVDCVLALENYWIWMLCVFTYFMFFSYVFDLTDNSHYYKVVCIEIRDRSENKTFQASILIFVYSSVKYGWRLRKKSKAIWNGSNRKLEEIWSIS